MNSSKHKLNLLYGTRIPSRTSEVKNRFLLSLVLLLIIISCENPSNDRNKKKQNIIEIVDTIYHNDGTKEVHLINSDSLFVTIIYNKNDIMIDSFSLLESEINGDRFEYFDSGEINFVTSYLHGIAYEGCEYNKTQNLVSYRAFDYHENLMFIASYKDQKVTHINGKGITSFALDQEYTKGSKIPLVFTIAKPPNLRTEVFVHLHNNSDVDSILHSDRNNRVKFDFEHDIVNGNKFVFHMKLFEDSCVYKDSILIQIDKFGKTSFNR